MTTNADRLLVDTNVLVYASLRHSPWHAQAIRAIHAELQAGTELWVSRQILREYLAVLTRPGTTTLASPGAAAAADVAAFERMFHVADDNRAVTARLLALVQSFRIGGKQVHDGNLVATMEACSATITIPL
ncbi:MAG: hypothetical protein J5I93_29585 [Pirellulaceae bacterium]|nr:hypothetical protein [Pirellulaceae bacterium]